MDNNVTRSLDYELNNTDWDVMILHYLGLDHIGHVFGPRSKLVPQKLREMDEIIRKLHEKSNSSDKNTMIIVTADHGMKDSGGHGGSSFAETHVPFVVLSQKCLNGSIEQVDVAPTLSVLLGVDIPAQSVGKIITNLMNACNDYCNYLLLYNSLVLNEINSDYHNIFVEAKKHHYEFLKSNANSFALKASDSYKEYLMRTSRLLTKSSVEQDLNLLITILMTITFCFLKIVYNFVNNCSNDIDLLIILSALFFSSISFIVSILIIAVCSMYLSALILIQMAKQISFNVNLFLGIGTILQIISLTSSSLIEEEHQTCYILLSTFLIYNTTVNLKHPEMFYKFLIAAFAFRLVRMINQTGDKWASIPDLADWFLKEDNHIYMQTFFLLGLISTWFSCRFYSKSHAIVHLYNAITLTLICALKIIYLKNVALGRLIWFLLLTNTVFCKAKKVPFINAWLLISSLLLREYNTILLSTCVLISKLICSHFTSNFLKSTIHYWLGNALYFCQGHSNSLASVDISVGYIGLGDYIPFIVILQVLCHTYALPILSHVLLLQNSKNCEKEAWKVIIMWRLFSLVFIDAITLLQRQHLFIWSVFAPKLLIESCHNAVLLFEYVVWIVFANTTAMF